MEKAGAFRGAFTDIIYDGLLGREEVQGILVFNISSLRHTLRDEKLKWGQKI